METLIRINSRKCMRIQQHAAANETTDDEGGDEELQSTKGKPELLHTIIHPPIHMSRPNKVFFEKKKK